MLYTYFIFYVFQVVNSLYEKPLVRKMSKFEMYVTTNNYPLAFLEFSLYQETILFLQLVYYFILYIIIFILWPVYFKNYQLKMHPFFYNI